MSTVSFFLFLFIFPFFRLGMGKMLDARMSGRVDLAKPALLLLSGMISTIAFVAWLVLPIVIFGIRKRVPLFRRHWTIAAFAAVALGSVTYVGAAWILDAELKHALDKLSPNGDGWFTDTEITQEIQEATNRYVADTGRTFAPFFAVPLTLIWTVICFLFMFATTRIRLRIRGRFCGVR